MKTLPSILIFPSSDGKNCSQIQACTPPSALERKSFYPFDFTIVLAISFARTKAFAIYVAKIENMRESIKFIVFRSYFPEKMHQIDE